MILTWQVTPEDQNLITAIGYRVERLSARLGQRGDAHYKRQDAMMDVTAVHANAMPLALRLLLAADDGDFAHDVFGIRRWIDRDTGRLGCFTPRFRA